MFNFIYDGLPVRVRFGPGCLDQLGEEVDSLGAHRVLVLCTPTQRALADLASYKLGARCAGVFDGARMHVPIEIAQQAREIATQLGVDCVVAIGGGSTIGLGKAIALESGQPVIAVPTTYAGSEMTPIYGITERGIKRTGRDIRVLPRVVLFDPELTVGLPVAVSVTSGLNAIAHAAEGLYARDSNPVLRLMAEEGIRALASGLPILSGSPSDLDARNNCLYGAWLCGTVLGQAGMALHHKLCHVLGGSLDLPHAETHAVMLPHTLAYNALAAPDAMIRIERAIGRENAPLGMQQMARELGAPTALRQLGVQLTDLDRVVDLALANPYWNPRPLERSALQHLLLRAWSGEPVAS